MELAGVDHYLAAGNTGGNSDIAVGIRLGSNISQCDFLAAFGLSALHQLQHGVAQSFLEVLRHVLGQWAELLGDCLIRQLGQHLVCHGVACLLLAFDKAFQHLDRFRDADAQRWALRFVLLNQRGGRGFHVAGREQGLAILARGQRCAVRGRGLLQAHLLQDALAHVVVHFHARHQHAAQLVVDHVRVLRAKALIHKLALRVSQTLALGQHAVKECLALLLGSFERLFHRLARCRRKRREQLLELGLVFSVLFAKRCEVRGRHALQRLCLFLQQGRVHVAFGHAKLEAHLLDVRICQDGVELIQRLQCFWVLLDVAKDASELFLGAANQHGRHNLEAGQLEQASFLGQHLLAHGAEAVDEFVLQLLATAHGQSRRAQRGGRQGQANKSGGRQQLLEQRFVLVVIADVLFDRLLQAFVASPKHHVQRGSLQRSFLGHLDGIVGQAFDDASSRLGGHDHGACAGSGGQHTSEGKRATQAFAHGAGIAFSGIARSSLTRVKNLGEGCDFLRLHAHLTTDFFDRCIRQGKQRRVESP